ncbi:MAG: thiamine diphosphokinase [Bacillota bacterium]
MITGRRAVIVTASPEAPFALERYRRLRRADDYLVAADDGLRYLEAAGLRPDLLIGDLDSLRPGRCDGIECLDYPAEKDETDTHLALDHLAQVGYREILVVAATGGRLDHSLANLMVAAGYAGRGVAITFCEAHEDIYLHRDLVRLTGRAGETVSLIPLSSSVQGVETQGLKYPLHGETLHRELSRGVSNELVAPQAAVKWYQGTLAVIHQPSVTGKTP